MPARTYPRTNTPINADTDPERHIIRGVALPTDDTLREWEEDRRHLYRELQDTHVFWARVAGQMDDTGNGGPPHQ